MSGVVAAAALCACGSSKKEAEAEREARERAVADLVAALGPDPGTERPPLARPGEEPESGAAAAAYLEAVAEATRLLADSRVHLRDLRSYTNRWPAADARLRAFGADTRAASVAASIASGARRKDGASPLAGDRSADGFSETAATVIAHALERTEAGEPVEASWRLAALVRMGTDLARGHARESIPASAEVTRAALEGLRIVLGRASAEALPAPALEELVGACAGLRASLPSFDQILASGERRRLRELATAGGDEDLERATARVSAVRDLAASRDQPAHARIAALGDAATGEVGSEAGDLLHPDQLARWLLVEADLALTCLALALELDRRARGELAPDLGEVAAGPLGELPDDPIGKRPFRYVPAGPSGRLIESMPVELEGKPVTVSAALPGGAR